MMNGRDVNVMKENIITKERVKMIGLTGRILQQVQQIGDFLIF
jgi:hypothetical protein